jgi:hypothetical protein
MAQVKFLKAILDKAGWKEMEATDDLTINSFSGNGSGLTNLNMSNASSGILDKSFYDATMAGTGLKFLGGVLSVPLHVSAGLGVDGTGLFVDYDGTTIGIVSTKLAVIGDYTKLAFKTINFITEDDVVATTSTDTLNIVAGANMTITTVAATKTITFASSGGGGGTYLAGAGLLEIPAGTFVIDYSHFNNWGNTQRISGFTGIKLDLQGTVGDLTNPLIRVQNSSSIVTMTLSQAGYLTCSGLGVSGDSSFGTTSANTLEIISSIISNISPDATATRDLGDLTHRWKDLYLDRLLGSTKTVTVNNLLDKSATESISGIWSFTSDVNIGDAATDTLTIVSVVDSHILPDAGITRDLGGTSNRWRNVYANSIIDVNSVSVATTRFQMIPTSGTSKPVASVSVRGQVYTTEGGTGVADVSEICLKSSADTYSWVNLATG